MPDHAPVLLVHGAWHGAWCWADVLARLQAAGHPAVAIDTPGHGLGAPLPDGWLDHDPDVLATAPSPLAEMTVADHARPVADAVTALAAQTGRPVVLVGHSLAGVTLHHVAEAIPEHLARLVYVAAFAPAPGRSVLDDVARPGFADSLFSRLPVADPAQVGVMRIDWRSEDRAYRDAAAECFHADAPDDLRAVAGRLLTPDEPASLYAEPAAITAERYGRVPRAFVRCTNDRAVPLAAQDEAIAALDEALPGEVFAEWELPTSHSPFLSAPDALADVLVEVAAGAASVMA